MTAMMVILSSFPSSTSLHPNPWAVLGIALYWFIGKCNFPPRCPRTMLREAGSQNVWVDDSRWHFRIPFSSVCVRNKHVLLWAPLLWQPLFLPQNTSRQEPETHQGLRKLWVIVQNQRTVMESGANWINMNDSVISHLQPHTSVKILIENFNCVVTC